MASRDKAIDRLTDDEVLALYRFIQKAGRSWRTVLYTAWAEGSYPPSADVPTLQRLRNRGGSSLVRTLTREEIAEAGHAVERAYATPHQVGVPS